MTGAAPQPDRCGHTWRADSSDPMRGSHVCWLPPGHDGDHRCTIGVCAQQPTTTPREPEGAS